MPEENPMKDPKNKIEKAISRNGKHKDFSLPALQRKQLERLMLKKLENKEAEKFRTYKKKVEDSLLAKEKPEKEKEDNLQFMKVKSYRSLLSSLSRHYHNIFTIN